MTPSRDREILRPLAGRVREIAELSEQAERKRRWRNLNALKPERPLVLCFPEGAWTEILPPSALQCQDPTLRPWEKSLRQTILWWEQFRDDNAVEPWFNVRWSVSVGDFGVLIPITYGANRGSYVWDPPIKDLERDLDRLRFRPLSVNHEATARAVERVHEFFGDLLPPRIRGRFWWSLGLTQTAIRLIGLEELLYAMCDQPAAVHRLMGWLRDEAVHFIEWLEGQELLTLDNEDDYVGSGGVGYTDELPQKDWRSEWPARLKDLWGFAESQETSGISPGMFGEFVFPYQRPLLERFGLNCYGCCEPVHNRMDSILAIPNLRRVSVAPWADQRIMAEKLDNTCIFSRKPNPALVCVSFNEDAIRKDLRATLETAGKGPLEIILKDTHTVEGQPWRLSRWVQIALEEVDRYAGGR